MKISCHDTFWKRGWQRFCMHPLGLIALAVIFLFFLVAVYAPFLASSKPLIVRYEGTFYFPLFRYLFYSGFYTKRLDLFFNVMIVTFPLFVVAFLFSAKWRKWLVIASLALQFLGFFYLCYFQVQNPELANRRAKNQVTGSHDLFALELARMSDYERLNLLLRYRQRMQQQARLQRFESAFATVQGKRWLNSAVREQKAALLRQGIKKSDLPDEEALKKMVLEKTPAEIVTEAYAMPTLWGRDRIRVSHVRLQLEEELQTLEPNSTAYKEVSAELHYINEKERWLEQQSAELTFLVFPLIRDFHWEDDAGGSQALNRVINLWELTRVNRKDMVAALIFGVRISLIVGVTAVALAMIIGVPIGAVAGYYGGRFDIVVSRLLEIWEAMPIFFMLLLIVAIAQSKSIFLIITVIGFFSWTAFSRYIRGEFFKQRSLSYVEACRSLGFSDRYIIFAHILPNAIPPVLTLLPFAIMAAITSEAGLSFLGLGEEGSCSWGVLMDEGRGAFPAESYLLWPPASLLTVLLIAIALVGDGMRDALDPKTV